MSGVCPSIRCAVVTAAVLSALPTGQMPKQKPGKKPAKYKAPMDFDAVLQTSLGSARSIPYQRTDKKTVGETASQQTSDGVLHIRGSRPATLAAIETKDGRGANLHEKAQMSITGGTADIARPRSATLRQHWTTHNKNKSSEYPTDAASTESDHSTVRDMIQAVSSITYSTPAVDRPLLQNISTPILAVENSHRVETANPCTHCSQSDAVALTVEPDKELYISNYLLYFNCVLILIAVTLLARSSLTGSGLTTQEGFLGMKTAGQFAIFTTYICMSFAHTFTQHFAGSTNYSLVSATALIYVFKFAVAFCMFQIRGTGALADVLQPASTGQSPVGNMPMLFLVAMPACMYALYDLLSFKALARMNPVSYEVMIRGRIVLIAGLWQPAMGRWLSCLQTTALCFFFCASVSEGISDLENAGGYSLVNLDTSGVSLIALQIGLSVLANVGSELCLKQIPLHTDLINTMSYLTGLFALSVFLVYQYGFTGLWEELLAPAAWAKLASDMWMIASIATLVVLGVTAAYFLRDLSNILKELASGVVVLTSAAVQYTTFKAGWTNVGASAALLAMLAMAVYNADPVTTTPSQPPPAAKNATADEIPCEHTAS